MTTKKTSNPTFYIDKNKEQPMKAGGVILYRFNKNSVEILLTESRGLLEDLGGCTDIKDKNIYHTVSREVDEESNSLIKKKDIMKRIKDAQWSYSSRSKYVIFLIKANEKEEKLKSSDFGKKELHDDIKRTISWMKIDDFLMNEVITHKINFRLKNRDLFNKLKAIKLDKQLSKSLFTDSSNKDSDSSDSSIEEKVKKPTKKAK